MTEYETVYILRADLADDLTKKANDKISEVIGKFQGALESLTDLGKKTLSYRIAKHLKGHYFQLHFKGSGTVVDELERSLRLSEDVLRFLTVKRAKPIQERV